MNKYGLVSTYTVKQFKVHKSTCNNDKVDNVVNREFQNRDNLDVVVSDLTYVNVAGKWNYICVLINLYNREIIGYSAGKHKTAELVYNAFLRSNCNLSNINIFHTDRGNEFKNKIIDEVLKTFDIQRSLSKKGCPYDNAVAEATFKIIKTEFAYDRIFSSFEELEMELFDYVNWYNNHRIHSALDYMTPIEYLKESCNINAYTHISINLRKNGVIKGSANRDLKDKLMQLINEKGHNSNLTVSNEMQSYMIELLKKTNYYSGSIINLTEKNSTNYI